MKNELEHWLARRKILLLTEKKEELFQQLRKTPQFRLQRSKLFETLSKLEHYQKETTLPNPIHSIENPLIEIPLMA